ncbi:amidohydrolase [Roseibium sp. SCP14]|uniref:amidohydrolase n=1 Tax=Roseibium sp. SCP14 TaxID=3141375 RepID=UPI00333862C1
MIDRVSHSQEDMSVAKKENDRTGHTRDIESADLVLIGGNVITVDGAFSVHSAVAVAGKRIIAVGTDINIRALADEETQVIDLAGKTVLPGIIDPHGHIHSYGRLLQNLDLNRTTSYQDIVDLVAERVRSTRPGDWIIGQGWDQNNWADKTFPTHHALSAVAPDNPVILNRSDGHAILVNRCAMDLAGIRDETPDPIGGRIVRDAQGHATGIFVELAEDLIRQYEPMTDDLIRDRFRLTANALLAKGVTSSHELGVSPQELDVYKAMDIAGELNFRVVGFFDDPELETEADYASFFEDNVVPGDADSLFTLNGIKLFRDGTLGSRSALLMAPYSDDPGNRGLSVASEQHVLTVSKVALKGGLQVITHAIGDEAVHSTLNAYERALEVTGKTDHRLRLEHAQIIDKGDIGRFAELGVIVSVQPGSAISDMAWTEDRVGPERVQYAYRFRDFIDTGAQLIISSDFPTESINPFETMYRAVTRKNEAGEPQGGWHADQALTIEEALKAHTIRAAEAGFQDHLVGSIEAGKLADLTVISDNILNIDPALLLEVKVQMSIVNGIVQYSSE